MSDTTIEKTKERIELFLKNNIMYLEERKRGKKVLSLSTYP